jgi:hypothetical protein
MVPMAQAARARIARRVANHRQSTDMASPKTSVAVSTLVARTTAPRAGTESGISVMSPRLVTEDTRPRDVRLAGDVGIDREVRERVVVLVAFRRVPAGSYRVR